MTAGFSYASGDAIIPMDCDLQDPPELIPAMIEKWVQGAKVVHAVRRSRATDSWLKRSTAGAFYRLMEDITDVKIPSNCGDYRLMDRTVVNAILSFPERNRFMKGIMAAAGFKSDQVEYDRLSAPPARRSSISGNYGTSRWMGSPAFRPFLFARGPTSAPSWLHSRSCTPAGSSPRPFSGAS